MIIYIVSNMTKVYPQMTTLLSFDLILSLLYRVYMALVVCTIRVTREMHMLSCHAAMVSLLWFSKVSNRSKQDLLWCQSKTSFGVKARPEMVILGNHHHLLLETCLLTDFFPVLHVLVCTTDFIRV